MRKSNKIILGLIFSLALGACDDNVNENNNNDPNSQDDGWITGQENGTARDTTYNDQSYRYYGGGWYPLYGGYICPRYYGRPYSFGDISSPGFRAGVPPGATSAHGVSTGGFGHSAGGEGAAGE